MVVAFWILLGLFICCVSFCILGNIKPMRRNSKMAYNLYNFFDGVYFFAWIIIGIVFSCVVAFGICYGICYNKNNFNNETVQDEVTNINNHTDLNIQTYEDLKEYFDTQNEKGKPICAAIASIGALFWILEIFIESLLFRTDRQIMKIKRSINKLSESPSEENKKLIALLRKTQKELEKQKELKNLQEGIRIIKRAKVNQSLNIQKDLDELQALCQLNETTLLEEKYK